MINAKDNWLLHTLSHLKKNVDQYLSHMSKKSTIRYSMALCTEKHKKLLQFSISHVFAYLSLN